MFSSASYRFTDFFDGTATPNTLFNILEALKRRRTSYLAQAMAKDVELYEATKDQPRPKGHPELVEFGLVESLLTGVVELLQQLILIQAGKNKKVKPLPRPITAKQLYERKLSKDAYHNVMSVLRFTDNTKAETGGD